MKKLVPYAVPVVVAALVIAVAAGLIVTFKLSIYRIETGSMEPNFPVGTLVVASGTANYAFGNPITFVADGSVVTHCYLGINADGSLKTRGIANPSNDSWDAPVMRSDVKGRVIFQIILFTKAFWTSQSGYIFLFGIFMIVFSVIAWYKLAAYESESQRPVTA